MTALPQSTPLPTQLDLWEGEARRVVLTPASAIKPKPVRWLWSDRIALGTLALLAGREGLGKSCVAYWLAAQVSRGLLPGECLGAPRSVFICATEDSWEHTIVPRLMAVGADLTRVYRVEARTALGMAEPVVLPRDLGEVEERSGEVGAALLILDPLMSRLSSGLDTHKDSEVRLALEPLVAFADRAGLSVVGLIHHNKGGSADPLESVMGSRAFTAVARSVHSVVPHPDDDTESLRIFGSPKNNLGRSNLPSLGFKVVPDTIDTETGQTATARVEWTGEVSDTIATAMRKAQAGTSSAVAEAAEWLADHLATVGGQDDSTTIKSAAREAGHSDSALRRARERIGVETANTPEMPRRTLWTLPMSSGVTSLGGDSTTDTTDTTGGSDAQSC